MNNKELAEFLNVTEPTIYNWKKEKPNLYKIIMDYKEKTKNILVQEKNLEIIDFFNELTDKEQEMYIAEIKARVLRRKLDQGCK